MSRGLEPLRHGHRAWAGAALLVLAGCMGGTGTDTENGISVTTRVIDGSGGPVAGVEMKVHHPWASAISASESPLVDPGSPLVTDAEGLVTIQLKAPGIYIAVGRRGDSIIVLDTLHTALFPGFGKPFVAGTPVRANGHVRLLSGFRADSGQVYLRGTSLLSDIGADGAYDLRWVPSNKAEHLVVTVVYTAKPAETRFVKIAEQGQGLSVLSSGSGSRCLSDSVGATTLVDTVSGTFTVTGTVARLVGQTCFGREGALVRALKTDTAGNVLAILGDYVIPGAGGPVRADSSALRASCVNMSRSPSDHATLRLGVDEIPGEIVVDDLANSASCR